MKNYIFDFDGTLADSERCSILATQAAFQQQELDVPDEERIRYFMGIPIERSFKEMAQKELSTAEFADLLSIFRKMYQQFEQESLRLFPGMDHVLNTLCSQQKNCFVVSSKKSDVLLRNLQSLHIAQYFKDIVGSDKVTNYKPHPEGLQLLLKLYGLEAVESVMIGDAIFDIQMGRSAGIKSCGVSWGSHGQAELLAEKPDYFLHQVADLLKL